VPGAQRGRFVLLTLAMLLLLGAAAGGAYAWLRHAYLAPGPATASSRIEVTPGTSLRTVLSHLQAAGTIRDARAIEWYLRLTGAHVRVDTGLYEIPAQASAREILVQFAEGRVVLEQLTVVEGATFADFLDALASHPRIAHTLRGRSAAQVMTELGHAGEPAEGEFFPDTYRFAANTADTAILTLAYEAMQRELAAAWQTRRAGLPLATPYQALILASVVEKEAAPGERAPASPGCS
jgi:UPF0755 protein